MSASVPRVTPRREGDPAPDLLGMRVAHRVLLRDARRLTDLAELLAGDAPAVAPGRAAAVRDYVRDWADSVHHHHEVEDRLVWPLLVASAGWHVDLTELTDDHAALGTALQRLRRRADAFGARPDEDAATALAVELAELRDALVEHVAAEEAAVLPLLVRHVSAQDWAALERRVRRGAALSFELPRVRAVLAPQEWRAVARRGGPALRLLLAVLGPLHRRRERAVFAGG